MPVKNEQQYLAGCLEALTRAARHSPTPVMIVVLDNADDSATIAPRRTHPSPAVTATALTIEANSVGGARAAGRSHILDHHSPVSTWLATTDADSRVPPNWFTTQLDHAGRGADLVIGTVSVDDWTGRSDTVRDLAIWDYAQTTDPVELPDDSRDRAASARPHPRHRPGLHRCRVSRS